MMCKNCGSQNDTNNNRCGNCGESLSSDSRIDIERKLERLQDLGDSIDKRIKFFDKNKELIELNIDESFRSIFKKKYINIIGLITFMFTIGVVILTMFGWNNFKSWLRLESQEYIRQFGRDEVEKQFESKNIRALVIEVAEDKITNELSPSFEDVKGQLDEKVKDFDFDIREELRTTKNDISNQIRILKERNEVEALVDLAIVEGDRDAYNKISKEIERYSDHAGSTTNFKKVRLYGSALTRIKSFYTSGHRRPYFNLNFDPNSITVKELLKIAGNDTDWVNRSASVYTLGFKKNEEVVETLINVCKKDARLDVVEESMTSLMSLLQVQMDVFDCGWAESYWRLNRAKVIEKW